MRLSLNLLLLHLGALSCGRSDPAVPEPIHAIGGADAETPSEIVDTTPPVIEGPTPCAPNSDVTLSEPLSKTFDVSGAPQTLKYQLQLNDCHGKPLALKNEVIAFDIAIPIFTRSWAYEVFDSTGATSLVSGDFNRSNGEDIFGPRNNYFLLKTNPLLLPDDSPQVILHVKIGAFTPGSQYPATVKTFQKLANSQPTPVELPLLK